MVVDVILSFQLSFGFQITFQFNFEFQISIKLSFGFQILFNLVLDVISNLIQSSFGCDLKSHSIQLQRGFQIHGFIFFFPSSSSPFSSSSFSSSSIVNHNWSFKLRNFKGIFLFFGQYLKASSSSSLFYLRGKISTFILICISDTIQSNPNATTTIIEPRLLSQNKGDCN